MKLVTFKQSISSFLLLIIGAAVLLFVAAPSTRNAPEPAATIQYKLEDLTKSGVLSFVQPEDNGTWKITGDSTRYFSVINGKNLEDITREVKVAQSLKGHLRAIKSSDSQLKTFSAKGLKKGEFKFLGISFAPKFIDLNSETQELFFRANAKSSPISGYKFKYKSSDFADSFLKYLASYDLPISIKANRNQLTIKKTKKAVNFSSLIVITRKSLAPASPFKAWALELSTGGFSEIEDSLSDESKNETPAPGDDNEREIATPTIISTQSATPNSNDGSGSQPTSTPTAIKTNTATITATATSSEGQESKPSPTTSPTSTSINTPVVSPSVSPAQTPTAEPTSTKSASPTATAQATQSSTATNTSVATVTATATNSNGGGNPSPTSLPINTSTSTPVVSPSTSPVQTPTAEPTSTKSENPTVTAQPTQSPIATNTSIVTVAATATNSNGGGNPSPTSSPINTSTSTPVVSPSNSPTQTPTTESTSPQSENPTATAQPTATKIAEQSATSSPQEPTAQPTSSSAATTTSVATVTATATNNDDSGGENPSPTASPISTSTPLPSPSATPEQTSAEQPTPTSVSTSTSTSNPTVLPGEEPTTGPTEAPTDNPTEVTTEIPTDIPTEVPTDVPTEIATEFPTEVPTDVPTDMPTDSPTEIPTDIPTDIPTEIPTDVPTDVPTDAPTDAPTDVPTEVPTDMPTSEPSPTEEVTTTPEETSTVDPTETPTETPSETPTETPTETITPTPTPTPCGNGEVDEGEECDDGNTDDKDGCDRYCKIQVCCICEWQDNGHFACDKDRFKNACDAFTSGSKCEKATVIVNPVTADIAGIPMQNPDQWCISNPARQEYSQCADKLTHYEYNGHGARDTAQFCVKAITEACTSNGGLPPKYMSCVFNSCNTVDDQAGLESYLRQVQSQYPWINWSIQGYPQTYFTDDGGSPSDICQPHLKYTINAEGLKMDGVPCSEVIGKPASQAACSDIETTVCIDDTSSSCPTGSVLPTKTLYSCPTNPSQHNGNLVGEEYVVDAIWQEESCSPIPCHSKCFSPPYQETGCQEVIGAGTSQCESNYDCE